MEPWVPAVTMIGLALIIGTAVVLRGPMGKALAEWIRGWSKTDEQWLAFKAAKQGVPLGAAGFGAMEAERLAAEVEELRRRVGEVEERVDFTERLLAKERHVDRLAPPR
ncbi:MAG TPA: hypothetical protein VGV12_04385 [Gemmatimonadales bacterium]|nr:hypothetical protein [Gemmatimonadales bacterium]